MIKQNFVTLSVLCACASGLLAQQSATEWEHVCGGSNSDYAPLVKMTPDRGFIMGGYSYSESSGTKASAAFGFGDAWLVKLDAARNLQWEKSFGGTEFDRVNDLQPTTDGGYIVGCTSFSSATGNKNTATFGNSDFWILKLTANGDRLWEAAVGGGGNDELRVVLQTSDGGYLAGGVSYSPASGNKSSGSFNQASADYWIVKLDAAGNKQWDRTFGGDDADELHAVRQTADGGFVLGGHSFSGRSGNKNSPLLGAGSSDFWLVKIDASGNAQWDRAYGGSDVEHLHTLQAAADGGFVLGGSSSSRASGNKQSGSFGAQDFWVVKIDGAGNVQWDRSYGGSNSDELHFAQGTADGGYLVGGISHSLPSGNKTTVFDPERGEYWFVKLDSAGNKQWEQVAPGSLSGEILRPVSTVDNGFIVAGLSTTAVLAHPDFMISKLRAPLHFISQSVPAPGVFRGQLNGVSGRDYVLQSSSNLLQWTAVRTNRASDSLVVFNHTNKAGTSLQFYRALPKL